MSFVCVLSTGLSPTRSGYSSVCLGPCCVLTHSKGRTCVKELRILTASSCPSAQLSEARPGLCLMLREDPSPGSSVVPVSTPSSLWIADCCNGEPRMQDRWNLIVESSLQRNSYPKTTFGPALTAQGLQVPPALFHPRLKLP